MNNDDWLNDWLTGNPDDGTGELPLIPEETIGWRAWIVLERRAGLPRLRSLMYDVVWPTDRWLVAGEDDGGGLLKVDDRGLCAARDREHLLSMHRYMKQDEPRYVEGAGEGGVVAIGEVGLAGVITPGSRGYQAERARVVSIELPYREWELVEPLARAYRVPVRLSNIVVKPPKRGGARGHRT